MTDKLPIALIGYGHMGRIVNSLAADYACEVVAIIDPHQPEGRDEITVATVANARVCIDFSLPGAAVENIQRVSALGLPVVTGATGWFQRLDEVRALIDQRGTGLLYGGNFSVGMNAFYAIVDAAAELMNHLPAYDPYGLEMHHKRKVDSPSGTAETLAQIVLDHIDRKQNANYETAHNAIDSKDFHFASVRAGAIPGTHVVGFDSESDTIELKHTARNRVGFASGALFGARWLIGRTGAYDFRDHFFDIIKG